MANSIDETDLRILAELDLNGRATASEIGRKLDMNKNTVKYRINDLESDGVIKKHVPIVDFFGLGYLGYRFCFRLQHTNTTIEHEIMDYLKDSPCVRWCGRAIGKYDVESDTWFRDKEKLNEFWNEFRGKFKQYINETLVMSCISEIRSGFPFTKNLVPQENNNIEIGTNSRFKINETEKRILEWLTANGRMSYTAVGKAVGLTTSAVKYRIDKLIEKKVIAGFRPLFDHTVLGYSMHRVEFNLDSVNNIKKIEQFVLNKPNVGNLTRNIGHSDLEIVIFNKTMKELSSTLNEIKDEYSADIRDFNLITYSQDYKEDFLPSC